ncbi:hypothetical protein [Mycolicibacterium sp. D5.8-2]|uniref:hypothetical protein n=1 Tax=Mycolicibacterium sp. D5.8-2 TaxID=3085903 RepID=UPI00298D0D9E|nr:hypothetical protein [Mycolicibacterium sp. D5.8-2]MDW5609724.1 hypothetical protein [Mycolicibacterium sp. D5.8-2]
MDTATFIAPTDPTITSVDVSVQCYGGAAAYRTFTIEHPPAQLELIFSPAEGRPGSHATATLHGCTDEVVLRWGNQAIVVSPRGEFTVPAGDPGTRTVTATCGSTGDDAADFTVLPVAEPTLELDSSRGLPGSTFRAIGHDFGCGDGGVELRWESSYLTTTNSGSFDETLTVPGDAQAGRYTVRATCVDDPDIVDEAQLTVSADVVTGTPAAAVTLSVEPRLGAHGGDVTLTGAGFLCDSNSRPVHLHFGGHTIPSVSPDDAGAFRITFTVPMDATTGPVTLRASCADGSVARTASFTVIAGPVTPATTTSPDDGPPPNNGVIVLVVLLVLAAMAITAVMVYRGLRKPRAPAPNPRVHVEQRIGDPPDVVLRETAGQISHAIRLSVHPGSATHTIERGER